MPRLTDEQQEAIESVDSHVLVSAGAGAGKTLVLVERYIEVLRRYPDTHLDDIIAVTYTRKAADEMRSRLKQRLRELSMNSEDATEKERWTLCLQEVDGAKIGTIHSLCDSILKTYPADAGVDPGFELLDDLERAEILKASIDEVMTRIIASKTGRLGKLLEYPVEIVQNWLSQLASSHLQYRVYRRQVGRTEAEIRSHAARFLEQAVEFALNDVITQPVFKANADYIMKNIWPDMRSTLGGKQARVISLLKTIITDSDVRKRWEALTDLGTISASGGGDHGQTLRDAIKAIKDLVKKVPAMTADLNPADDVAIGVLSALLEAADAVIGGYEERKRESQKLDFDDLIGKTHWLLTKPQSRARYELARKLRAVLVDEFQDTNTIQSELVASLAGSKTRLFLIGDDKQSIYKFQGADVGTFNFVKAMLGKTGNEQGQALFPDLDGPSKLLSLSWSFRSHPEIVSFVNAIFARLFGGQASSFRSAHQALRASRPPTEGEPRIDVLSFDSAGEESDESHRLEAKLVAQRIRQMVESGMPVFDKETGEDRMLGFGDFAVLLQASADFQNIEESLAAAGIPYVSYSGSGFLEKQEILDLENLLRFISSPQDSHALFAALRSPLFGVSDDLIHQMHAGKTQSLWQSLLQGAQSLDEPRLKRAVSLLKSLKRDGQEMPLSRLCRRIIQLTAYDVVLLTGRGGKQRSRNVWKFLWLAANHDHMSVTEFLNALSTMRELGVRNQTEAPLTVDGAVKVMTIHKSKGLEFGAVVLPRLDRKVHSIYSKLLCGKEFAIALDSTRDRFVEQKPSYFLAAERLNKIMDEEEKKRLLYVALTRARDYLCLLLPVGAPKQASLGTWLRSVLDIQIDEGECELTNGSESARFSVHIAELTDEETINEMLADATESIEQEAAAGDDDENLIALQLDEAFLDALADEDEETRPVHISVLPEGSDQFSGLTDVLLERVSQASDHVARRSNLPGRVTAPAGGWKPDPASVGTFFHAIMSRVSSSNHQLPDNRLLSSLLYSELAIVLPEQEDEMIAEAKRLFEIFQRSPLSSMIKSARRHLHELPYWVMRASEPEGRPDLVIEDEEGQWHIIDYKTDHLTKKDLEKQIRTHAAQLTGYVEDFRLITNLDARPWLYFAQLGLLEPVDTRKTVQLALPF